MLSAVVNFSGYRQKFKINDLLPRQSRWPMIQCKLPSFCSRPVVQCTIMCRRTKAAVSLTILNLLLSALINASSSSWWQDLCCFKNVNSLVMQWVICMVIAWGECKVVINRSKMVFVWSVYWNWHKIWDIIMPICSPWEWSNWPDVCCIDASTVLPLDQEWWPVGSGVTLGQRLACTHYDLQS